MRTQEYQRLIYNDEFLTNLSSQFSLIPDPRLFDTLLEKENIVYILNRRSL
jgi:hypothetical protein